MAKKTYDAKARTIIIFAGVAVIFAVVIGIWSFNRSGDSSTAPPPSHAVTAKAPQSSGDLDTTSTRAYDDLLQKSNAKAAEAAAKTGGSAMPVIRGNVEQDPRIDPPAAKTVPPPAPAVVTAGPVPANNQAAQAAAAEREKQIQARKAAMASQLALLQKAWTIQGHQTVTVRTEPADAVAAGTIAASAPTAASTGATGRQAGPALVHAGDTAVARLDTPIDTDNPLPQYKVTVIGDGPLDGAVLLGTIQNASANTYGSGVPLTFTQIILPGHAAQSVNAFAVNADDAGALKGQINRHVWSRYAAAFGGAFLQGVGTGLLQGGRQQQVITSTNGYAVQSDAFSNKQLMLLGAANVGQLAATQMQKDINRPPTITIPGNTTIAIFFTADLTAAASN